MSTRKTLKVRITEDLLEDLRALSKFTGRSMTKEVEIAIKKRCDFFKRKGDLQHCSQTEEERIAQEKYTGELFRLANWNWVPDD